MGIRTSMPFSLPRNKISCAPARAALISVASLAFAAHGWAQPYPSRVIKFLVAAQPGATPDVVGRLFALPLAEGIGQPVIVENRPGANGILGVEAVSRAAPDGYTLLIASTSTLSTNPFLYPKTGMLAVTGLMPVTKLIVSDFVVAARASLGAATIGDLISMVRAKPGALNASTSAPGSSAYLGLELLKQMGKLNFVTVTHAGGASSAAALAGGYADFAIDTQVMVAPLLKSGKVVLLATTGSERNSRAPEVPSVSEAGLPGFKLIGWIALMAPKGTPENIVATVQAHLAQVARRADIRTKLSAIEQVPVVNTPEQFAAELIEERQQWERVIKASGISLE